MTLRAIRVLKECVFVLCEDTRVTRKLLDRHEITTQTMSYHQHSAEEKKKEIFSLLSQGKNLALVTDAGTPGISDPGNELISFLLEQCPGLKIMPVPGPSALAAIASVAGIPMDKFLFLGYPPHKKGRKTFFEKVSQSGYPVVLYESPHRITKTLGELRNADPAFCVVVGRELTKEFEEVLRGSIDSVLAVLEAKKKLLGEFVLVAYRRDS
ncbi:MAG: 16S rRNA (cytidine(1402)-2'-O)-methyltransferase [Candidatus Wildermuthbacteria bacterium]|nr:16S rRNA (cytidine(1402)-2'-O)-methyltransferase [Candidatus Wildermuthbacteria bacterium]